MGSPRVERDPASVARKPVRSPAAKKVKYALIAVSEAIWRSVKTNSEITDSPSIRNTNFH